MTIFDVIILLLVASICGSVAMALGGFSRSGCFVSIAVGFVGAMIGMWLGRTFALPELFLLEIGNVRFPIAWSIIGAVIFVVVFRLLTSPTSEEE
jgi:uncharacterized membrane protein YeaQ/YmgE (transglycosylase-associated protein family)